MPLLNIFSSLVWFYRNVLQSRYKPGNRLCAGTIKLRLELSSALLPIPNELKLPTSRRCSPKSSISPFTNIILALSPPKVLLGLKPASEEGC